jgi:hypothetical protein
MGHSLKIKCVDSRENVHILDSTSVSFTLTMVQGPNLALTNTKRITAHWGVGKSVLAAGFSVRAGFNQRWAKGPIDQSSIPIRSSDCIGRYNRWMSSYDFCIG